MEVNLELPYITGASTQEQVAQMKSYLFQMVQQLQWAFSAVGEGGGAATVVRNSRGEAPEAHSQGGKSAVQTFNEIKALIIKSADIVEAYYEKIDSLLSLSGKYVASSDFGTYTEEVDQRISSEADRVNQNIVRIETISGTVDGVGKRLNGLSTTVDGVESRVNGLSTEIDSVGNWIKSQKAYIYYGSVGTTLDDTGLAAGNAPGIEIGDYQLLSDGQTVYANRRFARFTAYGLELFGENKDAGPVAYIKQNKLYIANAEVTGTFKLGGFLVSNSDGLSFDWAGVS